MTSNTKLTREMKDYVKQLREKQSGELHVFQYPEKRVTVAVRYIPGHNAARVFVSLASPDEIKFRPKVGEYQVRLAFIEWKSGAWYIGCQQYVCKDDRNLRDIHEVIADNVADAMGVPTWETI